MRRLGLIVLAVAVLLGGGAIFGLLNMRDGRSAAAPSAGVIVAARSIELGQALTPDMLRTQAWPADAVPEGSFTQISELTGGETRVALRSIAPNEPILSSRVSGAGGRATLSATIAEGHRAVSIRVNDVIGVGGFVLPGDFVDVLLTRPDGEGRNNPMRTDLLISGVRVLAIDQIATESRNDPQVARAVTIEVSLEDGQKVALASQIGTLSLALRRADEIRDEEGGARTRAIRIQDLRSDAEMRAAPRPAPVRQARREARPTGPTIEIVRGFTSSRVTVTE
jgi:pilus assembly protein CpaB